MMIAMLLLAASEADNCRLVTDDVIRMHDLAVLAPVFDRLDPETVVTYSPLPGAVRILQAAQLARIAKRQGIADGDFADACFARAMRQLGEQELLEALHEAVGIPGAQLQLVDFSRFPAPVGDLVFPRSGLGFSNSEAPLIWKGYVLYGSSHHFPVWARIRLRARLNRVIATDNLIPGKPVRADQVRIEPLDGVPDTLAPAQMLEQVVGQILLRPVRRGSTVSLDDLSTAISIRRGARVDVDLESPVLRLRFEATAESDARLGEKVRLRNSQTSNTFVAEVSGQNRARVSIEEGK